MFVKPSKPFLLYLAILSVAGGIAVYLVTSRQGPGVSTDAAVLLATADNLLKSRGLIDYRGLVLTQFPPLYSLILALGSLLFRQDVFIVGWALNIIVFGALIWFSGLYFYDAFKEERVLAYFASFIILSSSSLIQISANIASDPLFLLIVVFFLMSMSAYLKSERMWCLVLAAVLTLIACFQRYAGLSLVIAGALIVAYESRSNPRDAILRSTVFAVLTAAPILMWGYLHNAPISGTAFGGRLPALPALNFVTGIEKILYWFIPLRIISFVGPLLLLGAILCASMLVVFATHATGGFRKLLSPEVFPNVAFLLVYFAVLVFDISYYELKGLDADRVHIIILPSLLIVMFTVGIQLLGAMKAKFGAYPVYGLAILLFLIWSSYPINKAGEYVRKSMRSGDVSSYNSINKGDIRSSTLARYLLSLDLHGKKIYSNGGDSAWFILRNQINPMPMIQSDERLAYLKQRYSQWPGRGTEGYLIWFNGEAYKESYAKPGELSSIADLREIHSDEKGTVYYVTAR